MLTKTYGVRCDSCGSSGASGFATSELARKYVRRMGWVRQTKPGEPAKDICSRCVRRA